jgi:SAM-dependent methyltransferase
MGWQMSWSSDWETRYRENTHLSIWPWSDLVSYVHRYAKPVTNETFVLELGCGAGANIPFFLELGVHYFAIEGSPTMVNRLRKRFPQLKARIVTGDFTKNLGIPHKFDLVVDRASLTHNTTQAIRSSLSLVSDSLRCGGKFIGIDWFSKAHTDSIAGIEVDSHTRSNITEGPFADVGNVHFSDEQHLVDLFSENGLSIEHLEHKILKKQIPLQDYQMAMYNLCSVKL